MQTALQTAHRKHRLEMMAAYLGLNLGFPSSSNSHRIPLHVYDIRLPILQMIFCENCWYCRADYGYLLKEIIALLMLFGDIRS